MRIGDEVRFSLKGLFARPVETGFLILGIALGIGATATGLSLYIHTVKVGNDLVNLPQYREVIVTPGIDSENADAPALLVESTRPVNFSSDDLRAVEEIPAVSHAYLVRETEYRLGNVPLSDQALPGGGQVIFERQANAGQPRNAAGSAAAANDLTAAAGEGAASSDSDFGGGPGFLGGAMGVEGGLPPDINAAPPEMTAEERADMAARWESMRAESEAMVSETLELSDPEPLLEEMPGKMVSPAFFEAMRLEAVEGSVFTELEAENRDRVLVLGSNLAESLYEDGKSFGRQIIMNRQIYTIIGVLKETGTDIDNFGFTPYFISFFAGRFNAVSVNFMVADPADLDDAESQITHYFTQKHGIVSVNTPRRQAEEANRRNARLAIIILFLAGSGFFIAVVNVSNILLSRTIRQFRSIGIHKALGASRSDIFSLYFTESLFLSLAGMALGIVFTVFLSLLLKTRLSSGAMSMSGLLIGIIASTLITILITLYPSYQASKVPAAQAVKME